ncbi:hypothetical protein [Cohaesibacter gelatinilyticus]|uniref:CTP synthetase n=1 Tax=Cohaesibacter gelatinilyticus TaxID=372072 RepID=A0A285NI81_9HYPH|nr:hypothetical protein [Cohaesibacter gelatinilyticus]SNZ08613.1 hypothetical protein SAMN06265368_1747 [Cohaesibacter gelatinilyticus]HAT87105.1 hypothetical protein [Hyphomicrobiales bacterium]
MLKLTAIFYIIIAPTLAGIFALVPLTMAGTLDFDYKQFLAFVIGGAVLALPVSWFVAGKINNMMAKTKGPHAAA